MPFYLLQAAYTAEAWKEMVKHPQDRAEAVRPAIEKLGGKLSAAYIAFGQYDLVAIVEMPDNVSAGAFTIAAAAGGAVKALHTTPLMTMKEGMDAMKKASGAGYQPPS